MENNIGDVLNISSKRVIDWMNVIRDCPSEIRYRLMESFWDSQLRSKSWLVNGIKEHIPNLIGKVYIMGGWYGILAQLIVDNFNTVVYNIDLDESCMKYGPIFSNYDKKIFFFTKDMATYDGYKDPQLIINTSTEHVTQETYDSWWKNVPKKVPIIIQGNNFYDCYDHIRCFDTLEEFNKNNKIKNIIYTGQIECMGPKQPFHRFMTIGYK